MKRKSLILLVCAVLALGSLFAADRPREGKIVSIDKEAKMMVVQSGNDDQWTFYWTESTKFKDQLTVPELKVGDKVHFEYTVKDNIMWLTEVDRTEKAKD